VVAVTGLTALTEHELVGFPSFSRDENPAPDPVRIEAAMELIRVKVEFLKHALSRPWVDPGYDYENIIGETFPEIARALTASKILCDAASNSHARGRARESVDFLVITLGIADRLTVKSHLVQELVAVEIRTRALETLKRMLQDHQLGAQDLERLARALEACDPATGDQSSWMARQDLAVRLIMLSLFDRPELGTDYREALNASGQGYTSKRVMFAECFEAQDRYAAGLRALAERPLSERGAAAAELLASDRSTPMLHLVLQGQFGSTCQKLARVAQEYRLARLSVAVALYHAENGKYPRSLADLAPNHRAPVATDANYSTTDSGAMIVSRTRDPEHANTAVGTEQGPEANGFPAWRVRKK
jgi:hypothetical protein